MDIPYRFRFISTFAGCGGSSLGYTWAGGKELLAVEWDANAVETFKLNFPDVPVYAGDIGKLSVDECLELAGIRPGELDILDGSPPCQGFSTAGKRQFNDARNQLFREYVRLLRGLQPKVFVMENVSGLVKGKMKLIFAEIMRELKASGYKVRCQLMNAMYFNVPQRRERTIFIGIREDLGIEPTFPKAQARPMTVGEAIRGIENDPQEITWLLSAGRKYVAFQDWENIPIGTNRQSALGKSGFNCCKWDPNKPGQTIRKNDGHITMHGAMHWAERRRFTIAEFKKIASFPNSFAFAGGYKAVERIGNSVPPRFMQAIAEHIRDNLLNCERISDGTAKAGA